jgi:hypothetical protein
VTIAQLYHAHSHEGRAVIRGSQDSPWLWVAKLKSLQTAKFVYCLCLSSHEGIVFIPAGMMLGEVPKLVTRLLAEGAFGQLADGSEQSEPNRTRRIVCDTCNTSRVSAPGVQEDRCLMCGGELRKVIGNEVA